MKDSDGLVCVVDDDESVRRSLERLIKSIGLEVKTFPSAAEFQDRHRPDGPCCLILDIRMPGISGLDLQQELHSAGVSMPIIFITGHGTIPLSVRAMKSGAVDFLEKPFDEQDLLDAIHGALEIDRGTHHNRSELAEIQEHIESLTSREREVFLRVVDGRLNKQITDEIGTSEKTVKVHRAHVMQKMQADSLAALVHLASKAGILDEDSLQSA